MTRAVRLTLAVAIGVLLVLHAIARGPSQLLWACHVASCGIAIGLVFDRPRMVAAGVLFQVGTGVPAYLLDAIVNRRTYATSVLLHTVPAVVGVWALWGRPFPRRSLVPALLIHPAAMVAAYAFADPALNVMLVEQPWDATSSVLSTLWMSWLVNIVLAMALTTAGWLVVRVVWRRWDDPRRADRAW
jgi:hypothetical protein